MDLITLPLTLDTHKVCLVSNFCPPVAKPAFLQRFRLAQSLNMEAKSPIFLFSNVVKFKNAKVNIYPNEKKLKTTTTFGDMWLFKIAPRLWNQLPEHIRTFHSVASFRNLCKAFLFKVTIDRWNRMIFIT